MYVARLSLPALQLLSVHPIQHVSYHAAVVLNAQLCLAWGRESGGADQQGVEADEAR